LADDTLPAPPMTHRIAIYAPGETGVSIPFIRLKRAPPVICAATRYTPGGCPACGADRGSYSCAR